MTAQGFDAVVYTGDQCDNMQCGQVASSVLGVDVLTLSLAEGDKQLVVVDGTAGTDSGVYTASATYLGLSGATCEEPLNIIDATDPWTSDAVDTSLFPDWHQSYCGVGGSAGDVVFRWTAPKQGDYFVTLAGDTNFDSTLAVFETEDGTCGDCLGSDDNFGLGLGGGELVEVSLEAGQEIRIVVDGFGDATGTAQVVITDAGSL